MSTSAARYYQRAPRYVFRPDDKSLMRFAGMDTKGVKTPAQIRDLSSTGLSFMVESEDAPFENELLKLEFTLPGSRQIAWFANVVRVEKRSDWSPETGHQPYTLIALRFRKLPHAFHHAIERSLNGLVDEDHQIVSDNADPAAMAKFYGLAIALFGSFFWMSLPLGQWLGFFR
jgi:hypothetical protein